MLKIEVRSIDEKGFMGKEVKLHGLTAVASFVSRFRRGAESRPESHLSTPLQAWLSGSGVKVL